MKRVTITAALLLTLVLLAATAAAARTDSGRATAKAASPTTLTVWVGWSARELSVFKKLAAEYAKAHSDVTVKVVGGINDAKIVAAIRAGQALDVVSSFNSYNVGIYC